MDTGRVQGWGSSEMEDTPNHLDVRLTASSSYRLHAL